MAKDNANKDRAGAFLVMLVGLVALVGGSAHAMNTTREAPAPVETSITQVNPLTPSHVMEETEMVDSNTSGKAGLNSKH